jgi:hypothetical protein
VPRQKPSFRGDLSSKNLDWNVAVNGNRGIPQQSLPISRKGGNHMDRLQQISAEIIRLYRKQLNFWTKGKVWKLKDAAIRRYARRRERIEQLRRELQGMIKA